MEIVDVTQKEKETLLDVRNKLGISQSVASKILGISQALYSKIERGEKQLPEDKMKEMLEKIKNSSLKDKEIEKNKVVKRTSKKGKVKKERTKVGNKSQYKCPLIDTLELKDKKIEELEKLISKIRASISQLSL